MTCCLYARNIFDEFMQVDILTPDGYEMSYFNLYFIVNSAMDV